MSSTILMKKCDLPALNTIDNLHITANFILQNQPIGAFCILSPTEQFEVGFIWFKCATGEQLSVPIRLNVQKKHTWCWNGNETEPTISPSIRTENWHGNIIDGRIISE